MQAQGRAHVAAAKPVPVVATNHSFVVANALWSLTLFAILIAVIWYKLHNLRLEIHALVERLPRIGSEFIKAEVSDLREDIDETRARLRIVEEKLDLNGDIR